MPEVIQKTALLSIQSQADTAGLDASKRAMESLADATKKANDQLGKKSELDGILGRDKDGQDGFQRMLADREKQTAAEAANGPKVGPAKGVDWAQVAGGIAAANEALNLLNAGWEVTKKLFPQVGAAADRLGSTLTSVLGDSLRTALPSVGKLSEVLDGLATALGSNSHQADLAATALGSYNSESVAGQLAAKAQAEALVNQTAEYKKQADELQRIIDLKKSLNEMDARSTARDARGDAAQIDAMPEGPERDRAKTRQAGVEDAQKQADQAAQEAADQEAADAQAAQEEAKAQAAEAEAAKREKTTQAAKELELARARRAGLLAQQKDARDKQATADAAKTILSPFGLQGLGELALGGEPIDPSAFDGSIEDANAAANAAGQAYKASGAKGTAKEEEEQRREAAKRAREARDAADNAKANADAKALALANKQAEDEADYQQREGQRADAEDKSRDEQQKARRRSLDQMEADAEEAKRATMDGLAAHSDLRSGLTDLHRAHADSTKALANHVGGLSRDAARAANRTQQDLDNERERRRRAERADAGF
jgi:hypothetical protein